MYAWRPGMRVTAERLRAGRLAGTVDITPSTPVTNALYNGTFYRGEAVITFPAGVFTSPPVMSVTARSTVPGTVMECTYTSVSTTGVTVIVARSNQNSVILDWVAEQPL
ncbi:hypothetical protein ACFC1B_29150 [Streptomyces xiamenensis]|uniref:hypothetical protein n=1 Tax=Streptomyces xiamenensis TaxID=408015 RepID=UPI0035D88BE6